MARIMSITGKTTLLTTVCTCDFAAFQVLSMAPETSPAANAVTLNVVMTITHSARERMIRRDFFFMCIILLILF